VHNYAFAILGIIAQKNTPAILPGLSGTHVTSAYILEMAGNGFP
jgi:hypothetical protein